MKRVSPWWSLAFILALCFTLATVLVPRAIWWNAVPRRSNWTSSQSQSDNVFKLLLGEGRRLFGNEMFDMADSYFHSGYYPSIFDRPITEHDVAEREGTNNAAEDRDDFLGPPPDWIAALDRQFVPNRHTHLDQGGPSGRENHSSVEEILPWLKLATDMNPQFIKAYRVGYYWLYRLHMPAQARQLLLTGLRNNPGDNQLLFDLGWLYQEDFHDTNRARNVWIAGLRSWEAQPPAARTNTEVQLAYEETAMNLVRLEKDRGDWQQAITYLEMVKRISPNPDAIQKQIDEMKTKLADKEPAEKP